LAKATQELIQIHRTAGLENHNQRKVPHRGKARTPGSPGTRLRRSHPSTLAALPAGLEFGGPIPGGTGVFINGRELHPLDVAGRSQIVPVLRGRYWVDGNGNFGVEGGPPAGKSPDGSAHGAGAATFHPTSPSGNFSYPR
jgi:hypothetical protein